MAHNKRTTHSPYAKYDKAPFKYSDEFYSWQTASERHGILHEDTIAADKAFRNRWNIPYRPVRDYTDA